MIAGCGPRWASAVETGSIQRHSQELGFGIDRFALAATRSVAEKRSAPWCSGLAGLGRATWKTRLPLPRILAGLLWLGLLRSLARIRLRPVFGHNVSYCSNAFEPNGLELGDNAGGRAVREAGASAW